MNIKEGRNNHKILLKLNSIKTLSKDSIRQGFYTVGAIATKQINDDVLKKPRLGRAYNVKGRRHIASRQGESFASATGKARRTRGFDVKGSNSLEFGFRKDGETIYTAILEKGKLNRPTVKNASDKTTPKVQGIMLKEIKKAHEL